MCEQAWADVPVFCWSIGYNHINMTKLMSIDKERPLLLLLVEFHVVFLDYVYGKLKKFEKDKI